MSSKLFGLIDEFTRKGFRLTFSHDDEKRAIACDVRVVVSDGNEYETQTLYVSSDDSDARSEAMLGDALRKHLEWVEYQLTRNPDLEPASWAR